MLKLRKTLASLAVLGTATGIFGLATIPARAATPAATRTSTPLVIGSTTDFVYRWTTDHDGLPTDHPKPTIVLVHGAWADSSSWSGEIARLEQDGYPVVAAPNPLRGLSSDSATLADFLSKITGPIVLVGHSYGGAVITDAAAGNPNVKALVYDDAYIPAVGENISTLSTAASALAPAVTNPTSVLKLVPYPGAPDGIVDTYLLPDVFFNDFAPDIHQSRATVLEAEQSPTSLIALGEPLSTAPAWQTIPSWDIVGTQDKIIPEAAQLFMANRAHANVTTVDSGHLSLISHPDVVTSVIESAASATM
jgi:pimeloyl-ACP methyl ester carboxylesterase